MTSSLVGSEMCIRDRVWTVMALHWPLLGTKRLSQGPPVPGPHLEECAIPVSYTHLTLPTICSV
eukprot:5029332-Prorocentrum_lima.AAC.1